MMNISTQTYFLYDKSSRFIMHTIYCGIFHKHNIINFIFLVSVLPLWMFQVCCNWISTLQRAHKMLYPFLNPLNFLYFTLQYKIETFCNTRQNLPPHIWKGDKNASNFTMNKKGKLFSDGNCFSRTLGKRSRERKNFGWTFRWARSFRTSCSYSFHFVSNVSLVF